MKVSGVCPNCGRPTASKGRSECLYCGATVEAVPTGAVTAPGSGAPLPPSAAPPSGAPFAAPGPASPPRRVTVERARAVPNLYAERAKRMQAEGENPVAEFFRSGTGKVAIWVGSIAVVIWILFATIEHFQPKNTKALLSDAKPAPSEPDRKTQEAASQAQAATVKVDAAAALKNVADAIEKVAVRTGHYPDFVPTSLVGLEPGNDFTTQLEYFAGGRISLYRFSIDPATGDETFVLEAVSKATGETLQRTGRLHIQKSGFEPDPNALTRPTR